MQHHLSSQFETLWALADVVSHHGTHDFRTVGEGLRTVVEHCGLKIYFQDQMPVRAVAHDLDVVVERAETGAVPVVKGLPATFAVRGLVNSRYVLHFRKGDTATLKNWRVKMAPFVPERPASLWRKAA